MTRLMRRTPEGQTMVDVAAPRMADVFSLPIPPNQSIPGIGEWRMTPRQFEAAARAINNHDTLIEALEHLLDGNPYMEAVYRKEARAVLAAARRAP